MNIAKQTVGWALGHGLPRLLVGRLARKGDPVARLIVDPDVRVDPYPMLAGIRDRGVLVKGPLTSVTCSHAMVKEILRSDDMGVGAAADDHSAMGRLERVSTWARDPLAIGPVDRPSLLALNPPDHTRYRTLVSKVFTARAVERLRVRTEAIAVDLLDTMAAGNSADLIADYAMRLPVTVIAEILGVPASEHPRVLRFGAGAAPSLDMGLGYREYRNVESSLVEFHEWLGGHLEHLRRNPGDDLLSQLVAVEVDGAKLNDLELRATAGLLLVAGFETTVNLIGSGTALLVNNPGQLAILRDDPSLWSNAVDELLRLESPVQLTSRMALRDTELVGVPLSKGQFVTVHLAGANRDPSVFPDPDTLDVRRANARDHLSFSGGRHFCLGAALARMEGQVGLQALFERFPELTLAPGATRRQTRVLRGWETLPVTLRPAAAHATV